MPPLSVVRLVCQRPLEVSVRRPVKSVASWEREAASPESGEHWRDASGTRHWQAASGTLRGPSDRDLAGITPVCHDACSQHEASVILYCLEKWSAGSVATGAVGSLPPCSVGVVDTCVGSFVTAEWSGLRSVRPDCLSSWTNGATGICTRGWHGVCCQAASGVSLQQRETIREKA